ncbi:MAG TPA: hypothetical protein VH063_01170 [Gaiellaceae bacterium]|jgi:hypothetical protein|nr:hypothetical protein [Gaiellaceae bacterium]
MSRRLARLRDESGQTMMLVVFAIALVSTLAVGLTDLVTSEAQSSGLAASSDSAYQAAEAGIDSYASKLLDDHLYFLHYVADGESTRVSGSLTATEGDAWTGNITWTYPFGQDNWKDLGNGYAYNLEITAPSGSTTQQQEAIQIVSTGCRWDANLGRCGSAANNVKRTIQTLLLPSSVANFQMIANQSIVYGSTATTNGKIYSTGTVEHDGTASGDIYSEVAVTGTPTMIAPATKYSPSTTPNIRSILADPIDFSSFLTSITDIKGAADAGGVDLDTLIGGSPSAYEVVFNPNGTLTASACSKVGSSDVSEIAPSCGAATTVAVPSNGAVYANETVIIGGTGSAASTVDGRVTVTSNNNIVIGNNITYQPGTNSVLGLVALNNMIVAYWAPNDLTWYAATIATTGQWSDTCGVFNYQCGTHGKMTFWGSTATNLGGSMSMFGTRIYNYDQNLLWLLPPWFPTVDKPYTVLMQRELQTS